MSRDPFDRLAEQNPVPPEQLPRAPRDGADRIIARRSRPGWLGRRPSWVPAAATAVAVLLVGGAWLLWLRPGHNAAVDPTTGAGISTTVDGEHTTLVAETTAGSTSGTTAATTAPEDATPPVLGVYFLGPDLEWRSPVVVAVARDLAVLDVRPLPDLLPLAAEILLAGPGAWDAAPLEGPAAAAEAALSTAIPAGTRLLGIEAKDGIATIDLSAEFAPAPGEALAQVVFTLTRLEGITGVQFEIEGTPYSVIAGSLELVPTAAPPDEGIREDPATRQAFEGLMPISMLEDPALGGSLKIPGVIAGIANPFDWLVTVAVGDASGVVLWETEVEAVCGTPWSECRGEFDWSVFSAVVPAGIIAEPQWGTIRVSTITEDGAAYATRETPVRLIPGPWETPEPSTTTSTTTSSTTTTLVDHGGAAPWSQQHLREVGVPARAVEAWKSAANRTWCSALFPAALPPGSDGAEFRLVDFSGGWGFGWDLPAGPGRNDESGDFCADCGTAAFGVAGAGFAVAPDNIPRWPAVVEWDDGSAAGYGPMGYPDPVPGGPTLAYLTVSGQGCLYDVWSFLGDEHLRELLDGLRLVEGLEADPVTPITFEAEDPVALGPAPWTAAPLPGAAVPDLLRAAWQDDLATPAACPLLVPTYLGDAASAGLRRNPGNGELAISWDLRAGPGRYPDAPYCSDCGRSAVGMTTTLPAGANRSLDRFPATHTWDDGSTAWVMSEGTEHSGGIPDALLTIYTDARTGAPLATHPWVSYLQIPGFDCGYYFWSFLGEDHLMAVLDGLRRVEGAP